MFVMRRKPECQLTGEMTLIGKVENREELLGLHCAQRGDYDCEVATTLTILRYFGANDVSYERLKAELEQDAEDVYLKSFYHLGKDIRIEKVVSAIQQRLPFSITKLAGSEACTANSIVAALQRTERPLMFWYAATIPFFFGAVKGKPWRHTCCVSAIYEDNAKCIVLEVLDPWKGVPLGISLAPPIPDYIEFNRQPKKWAISIVKGGAKTKRKREAGQKTSENALQPYPCILVFDDPKAN